jgi:DmsE family decaheme c-type cytochrome
MRFTRAVFFVTILALGITAFAAADPGTKSPANAAGKNTAAAKGDGDYVGTDTCITCHEDQQKRFKNTVMGKIMLVHPRTELEKRGCEACHGPGKNHVENGGGKDTIPIRFGKDSKNSVEEQNSACLSCHSNGNRMFWEGSPHQSRNMACVDCHNIKQVIEPPASAEARFNAPLTEIKAVKKTQPELCLDCHQMRRAQLQRSSHMPFREGKVTCTSCHNPHGTPNPKQLIQATVNENCYSCHAERRGPFLWEHPPVLENCMNCHEAHGSTNPQLLKTREPRLCQQCHDNSGHPANAYGVSAASGVQQTLGVRVLNRGCTNCHSTIHGSNHPSGNHFRR